MVKIAVEEPFTSVHQALLKRGYQAEMLDDKTNSMNYDCVVVRDKEDLADFHMNVPLVEAKGRTLQEIIEEVEERLVRAGKIVAPKTPTGDKSGGGFIAGVATGAIVGAAAGLLLTPKSGKEMQGTVKEKITEMKEKKSEGQDENQGPGKTDQMKEKLGQVKEKASGVTEKAKAPVDKLKAKRQEKQEEKELKKQEKAVEKEAKAEEKAQKEHEKAEKQAEKEEKKADKEAKQEQGGIQLEELGDASVEKNSMGDVQITSNDDQKNK